MRARLRIPAQLAVTVLAASGCSDPPSGFDAAVDVARVDAQADAQGDVARDDVLRDVILGDVVDAARECTRNPFDPENPAFAVQCRRRPGASGDCPTTPVCVAADCPANCEGCVSPLFCIPDNTVDAGVACVGGTACSGEACPPGCRAVG